MSDVADPRPAGPSPSRTTAGIIPFPAGGRPRRPDAAAPADARILLFTGVRYERVAEAPSVTEAAPEGVRRRAPRPRRAAPARRRQPS